MASCYSHYIRPVSDSQSRIGPFKSLDHALEKATRGDVILFCIDDEVKEEFTVDPVLYNRLSTFKD